MKKKWLMPLLATALIVCGCGIETYVYLYPVTQILNTPASEYDSTTSEIDPSYNYFEFKTSDKNNADEYGTDGYFKGFEVYYRIYNSNSKRSSDASAIYNYNDDYPTAAVTYLVNTKKYKRMGRVGRATLVPLLAAASENRDVAIRLTASGTQYSPYFKVDDTDLGEPLRTLDDICVSGNSDYTFDYDEIDRSDDDVENTASSGTDIWYVQAYVAAYGYDESYKPYYSEVFSLSYVTISDSD